MNLSLIKILSIEFRKEWNLSRTGIWKHQNLTLMLPKSRIIFWYIKQNAPVVEEVFWLPDIILIRKSSYISAVSVGN